MTVAARAELRSGAIVAASLLAAGAPVAVVWWLVAPLPALVVNTGGVFFTQGETEYAVAADGWFAICTATAGLVAALVVFARTRHSRAGALAGLAVGGLLGSVLTWRLGVLLGPGDALQTAKGLQAGTRFDGPLKLSALGVLFGWPIAAVVAWFALTAGLEPPERPGGQGEVAAGPPFPVTVLRPGYAIDEVDELFRRLDAGQVSLGGAREVRFSSTRLRRGYDGVSVDAALDARAGEMSAFSPPGHPGRPGHSDAAGESVPPQPASDHPKGSAGNSPK